MRLRFPRFVPGRPSGALTVIAALFLSSGAVRVWDGAAVAEDVLPQQTAITAADEVAGKPTEWTGTRDISTLLAALQEREARVAAAEADLANRMSQVAVAEETIRHQLEALAAAEASLEATMARSQAAAEDDLERLTSVYENMKPKDAAALFAQMDPDFAAGFLGRMRADAAAAIMAGLDPAAAYTISVLVAGRNADAPVE